MLTSLFSMRSFRPPDLQPDRSACNWMLGSAALAVAFHAGYLPLWLSALAGCLLLWRFFIENHAWRIPGRVVRWSLLLLTAVITFRHYGTITGRDAGVAYLTLLVALKILEIRSLRDYLLAVFLVYVLVLGALLFSQSLATGAFAALVLVVTTQALVRLNRPQPLSQVQTLRVVLVMLLQALPLLLALYLLFPRIQGSLWGLPKDAYGGRTGMSEEVAPGSINRLFEDDTIAFRVEFVGPPPKPAQLYWRAFVLSDTNGTRWRRHHGVGDGGTNWRYEPLSPAVRYGVTLEPHYQHWLPVLDLPLPDVTATRRAPGYVLESRFRVRNLRHYELASHLKYRTGGLSAAETDHNTRWPRQPAPRVAALVDDWKRRSRTAMDVVQRSLDHFSQEAFRYTLSPPLLTGDTLDAFLFETRAGYCEHFAAAFTALMRLSGIPARVVVGYQGGEWNETGKYMVVRQSDAHAWAEVWLPSRGWTRVDPTAAVAPERVELGARALRQLAAQGATIGRLPVDEARLLIKPTWTRQLWRDLQWRWDVINNSWNRWVMAYGPKAQLELLELLGMTTPTWIKMVALMSLFVVLVLLTISAFWMYARRSDDPVVTAYRRFCNKLKRVGCERRPTEGPLDYARRLQRERPDLSGPVSRITATYIALRYGSFSRSGLASLRKQVAAFRVRPAPHA